MIISATAHLAFDAQGDGRILSPAEQSAQMEKAIIPKAGGMISVPGHIVESRLEAGPALPAIVKAFQVAAGLAKPSSVAKQRVP